MLILIALVLVVAQPTISARLKARRQADPGGSRAWTVPLLIGLTGVYGGTSVPPRDHPHRDPRSSSTTTCNG
ncbi:MAG: hypothetical protein R2715_14035 [Ilumatobacteraceae bacterium]